MPRPAAPPPNPTAAPRRGRAPAEPVAGRPAVRKFKPRKRKVAPRNAVVRGDCLDELVRLPDGCVDLAFADPPFNIGFDYDEYRDRRSPEDYAAWCRDWIEQVHRVLRPDGTFWLAVGDEVAAELKVLATGGLAGVPGVGFHCRSWVVWYYTFGVNCTRKFTRSHAHLFHFVKDEKQFTFNADDPLVRTPSARQLVYNDPRANPAGRLPDDTWTYGPESQAGVSAAWESTAKWALRPQDVPEKMAGGENTWYFPRVAGTFKERRGFHGCQMPEQLMGRIVRVSSSEGDLVLDPFAGSGTTPAVAKKLGRDYLAFELSADYAARCEARLAAVAAGDPLNGSDTPALSAPSTRNGRKKKGVRVKSDSGGGPQVGGGAG